MQEELSFLHVQNLKKKWLMVVVMSVRDQIFLCVRANPEDERQDQGRKVDIDSLQNRTQAPMRVQKPGKG